MTADVVLPRLRHLLLQEIPFRLWFLVADYEAAVVSRQFVCLSCPRSTGLTMLTFVLFDSFTDDKQYGTHFIFDEAAVGMVHGGDCDERLN